MVRVASVAVLAFGLTAPRAASADGPEAWLHWSSPPNACGDAASFATRVERALGRSPSVAAGDAHVKVVARIETATVGGVPRWVGEVRLRSDGEQELGSRALDRGDASCQPLVDALAVVTALALAADGPVAPPAVSSGETAPGEAPPLPAPPPPSVRPPQAPPVTVAPVLALTPSVPVPAEPAPSIPPGDRPVLSQVHPPGARLRRFGVEGEAKVAAGLMPRTALGAEVSASLHLDDGWKFFLALVGWEQQTTLDDLGRGASFQRLEGGLGVCPLTVLWNRWTGNACARGDVGLLRVTGMGFLMSSTEDRLTLAAEAGIEVQRAIVGPLAVGVTASAMVPVIRDRISYTVNGAVGSYTVYQQAPLAALGAFRLSCVF